MRYVVLRNDLDYGRAGSERPLLVHETILGSPGFARVRTFGPEVGGGNGPGRYVDEGLDVPYRAVEVFEVNGWVDGAAMAPVENAVVVAGGPESLLSLAAQDWLGGSPAVLAADADVLPAAVAAPAVLTDGLRRREVFFGRSTDNVSHTLTRDDPLLTGGAVPDYLAPGWEDHRTVAKAVGVRSVQRRHRVPMRWRLVGHGVTASPGRRSTATWPRRGAPIRVRKVRIVDGPLRPPAPADVLPPARRGDGRGPTDVTVRTDSGAVTVDGVVPGRWTDVELPVGARRPGDRIVLCRRAARTASDWPRSRMAGRAPLSEPW